MNRFPPLRLLAVVIVPLAAAGLISCSGSDSPTGPGGGGTTPPNTVNISGNDFSPADKTIAVGTKITWVNKDGVNHTVTSDNGAFTSSGTLAHNATYEFTFTTPGTYPYHCAIHAAMKDTITVTP